MGVFSATFSAIAVSAAQDLFEIVAPAAGRIAIRDIKIGQYSDFGDAAAENLSIQVIRGFTTTGSGGAAVTPSRLDDHPNAGSSGATVARNNTTVAQDGTGAILVADTFNIAAGWALSDVLGNVIDNPSAMIDKGRIMVRKAERLVVRITAPADALTMNGTMTWEELPE